MHKKVYTRLIVFFLALFFLTYYSKNIIRENRNKLISQRCVSITECIEMWKIAEKITCSEVIVAVIDSGINFSHKDSSGLMWKNINEIPDDKKDNDNNGFIDDVNGWNFVDNTNELLNKNLQQEDYHGTMCAGIIATTTNGISRYKSSSKLLKIMSIKVLNSRDEENVGSIDNLIKAIKYAENNGASICNISLNTYEISDELENIIKNSHMLFIVSAGNSTPLGINIDKVKTYPACYNYDNVLTVSSIDDNNNIEIHSNYGKETIDVLAPGTDILSTSVNNTYSSATGTSMATPIVTGIAAEIYMCNSAITPNKVKEIICASSDKSVCSDNKVGTRIGIVNGKNALMYLKDVIYSTP